MGCGQTVIKREVVRVKVPAVLTVQEPLPSLDIKTNGDLLDAFIDAYSGLERANLKLEKIKNFSEEKACIDKK